MISNILVIFLIIMLSYVFKMNEKMNFDSQMLFIFLSISLLVFYKFMMTKKRSKHLNNNNNDKFTDKSTDTQNNENFQSATDITEFSESSNTSLKPGLSNSAVSNNSLSEERIRNLENTIEDLQAKLITNQDLETNSNPEQYRLLENTQTAKLILIQEKINHLKNIINSTTNQDKEYKKIPVYNSCILTATGDLEKQTTQTQKDGVKQNNLDNNNTNTNLQNPETSDEGSNNRANTTSTSNTNDQKQIKNIFPNNKFVIKFQN